MFFSTSSPLLGLLLLLSFLLVLRLGFNGTGDVSLRSVNLDMLVSLFPIRKSRDVPFSGQSREFCAVYAMLVHVAILGTSADLVCLALGTSAQPRRWERPEELA